MYKIVVVFAALLAVCLSRPEEKYTTKYDGVDLDEILNNERLLNGYCNCMLDKGACSPDGAELKRVIPDALETECKKCNDKQKEGAKKVLRFIYEKRKDCFDPLEAKYDPKGEYRNRYRAEAEKEGVKL